MVKRPSIDNMMMKVAETAATRSTCSEAAVGAVVATADGRILSFGYNGVPRGIPHCTEVGCIKDSNGHHLFLVHAETNAIINAAREGICLKGATIYVTRFPCNRCAANIIQAGISRVMYDVPIDSTARLARKLFSICKVEVYQIRDERMAK